MSRSRARLRFLRKLHLYFGVFISPALLFFAFTALQTFGLHEAGHRASTYRPPHWAEVLGQVHKKQTTILLSHKPPPVQNAQQPSAATAAGHARHGDASQPAAVPQPAQAAQKSHLPLKIFFLIVSIGMFLLVLTGIYMAYKYNQSKLVITALLTGGIIVPLALLPF